MKKFLLSLAAFATAMCSMAGVNESAPATGSMQDAKQLLAKAQTTAVAPERTPVAQKPYYDWTGTDTVKYLVAARSYALGTKFNINGGDVKVYELGVARKGDVITFTNLFNSYDPGAWAANHDLPIEGDYYSEEGTIKFATGLDVIDVYGSYIAHLKAGEFAANGMLTNELGQLVFEVTPDFRTIKATSPFGAEYNYGWAERFKDFIAVREDAGSPAELIAPMTDLNLGRTYPGMPIYGNVGIVNVGGTEAEYVVEITDETGSFEATRIQGVLPPFKSEDIEIMFDPKEYGDINAIATFITDGCDPVVINLTGRSEVMPDYSDIVVGGDFTFETTIDYPGEVVEFEHPIYNEEGEATGETETIKAVKLTCNGTYGQSDLMAKFTVPEGMEGKLKLNGYVYNASTVTYLMNSFLLVDEDDKYRTMYVETGDYKAEDRELSFAPGDHYVYFVHLDGNSKLPDMATYVWGLELTLVNPNESGVDILTPEVFMGYGVVDGKNGVYRRGALEVINKGTTPLKVLSVTCDNDEFEFTVPAATADLLETITIPFYADIKTAGEKFGNVTIETTAGTVEAVVSIYCIEMPDYSTLVTEGREFMSFDVTMDCPFLLEDGKAYNITSMRPDTEETLSCFGFEVNVPQGQTGYLIFSGHSWGTPYDKYEDALYWDYGYISLHRANGHNFWGGFWDNDIDVNEKEYWERIGEADQADFMILPPGRNLIEFGYIQGGDRSWYGMDRLEIYSIGVRMVPGVGIEGLYDDSEVTREYYDLEGRRLNGPQKGINVVRTIYPDGNIKTSKIVCSASR